MSEDSVTDQKRTWRWPLLLVLISLLAGGAGYVLGLGYAATHTFAAALQDPVARLGFRLTRDAEAPTSAEWLPPVEVDIEDAQSRLVPSDGKLLRMVLTLRGDSAGKVDFARARKLCGEMGWERCDQAALERMVGELRR